MSRQGSIRRADGRTARLAAVTALAVAAGLGSAPARAQEPAPPTTNLPAPPPPPAVVPLPSTGPAAAAVLTLSPSPAPAPAPADAPGAAVVGGPDAPASGPVLPADVQVVRFHGPEGLRVEVLGPNPEPVPVGDNHGVVTVGLKVGVAYRLRLSNLSERPGAEIFPVIEILGHLHRPPGIDPGKYPIRVAFTENDFIDVADHRRLVTQVIYLEDPEQALPISLPKDEIPVVSLGPGESPLKVAAALGRVMALVRMGDRRPTPEEVQAGAYGVPGPGAGGPCPFTGPDGGKCPVACGPVVGTPPPPGRWVPRDEFLCDGGDHAEPAHFGGDGGLRGIDPRDALIRFDDGRQPRSLPTNVVCVYAPRFAEVRVSVGPNQTVKVESTLEKRYTAKEASEAGRQGPNRLVQNQGAEAARNRARPSGLAARMRPGVHGDVRAAVAYDNAARTALALKAQGAEFARARQKLAGMKERVRFEGIKTAESAVVTGVTEGAGQTVMTWTPRETVGVETPPNRPGLAVLKRVSAGEAEAGDVLTFVIQYRNMGNTPIHSVSVVDSLLPRLGYVKGSARAPKGTTFTAEENRVGSTELRWTLPGPVPPGVEGNVSFQAVVR